jgi:AAA family ATP:ADP antiporter
MFFLISLNYNALRVYKDTFIVTANFSGAEAIPFIKTWVVVPSAILCTLLYTRLANLFRQEIVTYIILSLFIAFFFLFAFVFYPAQDFFHPNHLADQLQSILPPGCKGLVAAFRNWTFTLFYVFSELWSTMIFTVLFWGFVNEITSVHDARRHYGFIMTVGNVAGILSGHLAILFSQDRIISWIPYGKNPWDQSVFLLTSLVIVSGILIMLIFRWLHLYVLGAETRKIAAEPRAKLSMRQSFRYLIRSRYLGSIAILVMGYNISFNLIEVIWKDQIKQVYPEPAMYNVVMGKVIGITAIVGTLAGFFITSGIIRRFPWRVTAMIPPMVVGGSGILFFSFLCAKGFFPSSVFPASAMLGVFLGALQNCLTRATKYTLFDATKEIALVPLDNHSKLVGKAAIDGVSSRIGKSAGSLIHQVFLILFTTLSASTPYIAIVFLAVVILWSFAVNSIGKQFEQLATK